MYVFWVFSDAEKVFVLLFFTEFFLVYVILFESKSGFDSEFPFLESEDDNMFLLI